MKELKALATFVALLSLALAVTAGTTDEAAQWLFSAMGWGLAALATRECPKP